MLRLPYAAIAPPLGAAAGAARGAVLAHVGVAVAALAAGAADSRVTVEEVAGYDCGCGSCVNGTTVGVATGTVGRHLGGPGEVAVEEVVRGRQARLGFANRHGASRGHGTRRRRDRLVERQDIRLQRQRTALGQDATADRRPAVFDRQVVDLHGPLRGDVEYAAVELGIDGEVTGGRTKDRHGLGDRQLAAGQVDRRPGQVRTKRDRLARDRRGERWRRVSAPLSAAAGHDAQERPVFHWLQPRQESVPRKRMMPAGRTCATVEEIGDESHGVINSWLWTCLGLRNPPAAVGTTSRPGPLPVGPARTRERAPQKGLSSGAGRRGRRPEVGGVEGFAPPLASRPGECRGRSLRGQCQKVPITRHGSRKKSRSGVTAGRECFCNPGPLSL